MNTPAYLAPPCLEIPHILWAPVVFSLVDRRPTLVVRTFLFFTAADRPGSGPWRQLGEPGSVRGRPLLFGDQAARPRRRAPPPPEGRGGGEAQGGRVRVALLFPGHERPGEVFEFFRRCRLSLAPRRAVPLRAIVSFRKICYLRCTDELVSRPPFGCFCFVSFHFILGQALKLVCGCWCFGLTFVVPGCCRRYCPCPSPRRWWPCFSLSTAVMFPCCHRQFPSRSFVTGPELPAPRAGRELEQGVPHELHLRAQEGEGGRGSHHGPHERRRVSEKGRAAETKGLEKTGYCTTG